ncbi:uncharacterized protein SCODWIG_00736 [Saccharomycodes ludwigii]|uniref:Pore membrane protein of 33 kDa n=1 Tax=Saccharomycodes ludwigii TaxID=36035 RepID=A0A376B2S1_9ASCO|nr:hypothetical protein SCDLUD_001559 [Saccharomycodes ludwigii]KAH3901781.1 hypothetical protein SCDLUD_001559 [Saccharomycodes ludwigii]SSD58975.1 uncharacterized protein SCODWIG_00736 [Saccharomycodes ludwigii]
MSSTSRTNTPQNKNTHASANASRITTTPFQRLILLTKTTQFAWFVGHFTTFLSFIFYNLNGFPQFLYNLFYVGVLVSFGVQLYQCHFSTRRGAAGISNNIQGLISDVNFPYFIMAILWLLTPVNVIGCLPFFIFSLFHSLTYLKSILLPQVFNPNLPIISKINSFLVTNQERSMIYSANLELACLFSVFFRALLWRPRSWIVLIAYILFIRTRYHGSIFMQDSIRHWVVRLDGVLSSPNVNIKIKMAYTRLKAYIERFDLLVSQYTRNLVKGNTSGSSDKDAAETKRQQ